MRWSPGTNSGALVARAWKRCYEQAQMRCLLLKDVTGEFENSPMGNVEMRVTDARSEFSVRSAGLQYNRILTFVNTHLSLKNLSFLGILSPTRLIFLALP